MSSSKVDFPGHKVISARVKSMSLGGGGARSAADASIGTVLDSNLMRLVAPKYNLFTTIAKSRGTEDLQLRPPANCFQNGTGLSTSASADEMRYAANIERALSSWEISPEEWADYIAFLARLLKAIQSQHKDDVTDLPHSGAIATRLAQCLNPALPSGVHQKALEVYTFIFSKFSSGHIANHIHEYLPGLTAVLSFASLSVRPGLYRLFEDHIAALPLSALRPALKSLILSLLPALEDETGEDFERAFNILHSLERSFSPDVRSADLGSDQDGYFWQCLFLSVITSPSRRQGALNYLARALPKLPAKGISDSGAQRAANCIISPEPGLLIRCFICGLSDFQVLIQRGFLDLLVTHLPLNSQILQEKIGTEDMDRLVAAAILVLLRRDMSLNRRLWSWFLGPEPKDQPESRSPSPDVHRKASISDHSDSQLRYFSAYGKASLQRCIVEMLQNTSNLPPQRARPFRICLSLMDRWEIGGLLVSQIFLPAMRNLYQYSLTAPANDVAEVVRSASLFFDGVEASLIWECLLGILSKALESRIDVEQGVQLFRWIIKTFNVRDEEMLTLHIPQSILYLITAMNGGSMSPGVRVVLLDAAVTLLDMVPARIFQSPKTKADKDSSPIIESNISDEDARRAILEFYQAGEQVTGRATLPFTNMRIAHLLTFKDIEIVGTSLSARSAELFSLSSSFLVTLSGKAKLPSGFESPLLAALRDSLGSNESSLFPFPILSSAIGLLSALTTEGKYLVAEDIIDLESALTSQLWAYMSPELPKYHVEAVKVFWQLQSMIGGVDVMAASLAGLVRNTRSQSTAAALSSAEQQSTLPLTAEIHSVDAVRRFAVLWNHSIAIATSKSGGSIRRGSAMTVLSDAKAMQRKLAVLEHPLMLILDSLGDTEGQLTTDAAGSWLHGLPSLEQVFTILLRQLQECLSALTPSMPNALQESSRKSPDREREDRVRAMNQILSRFQNILAHGNTWTWECLKSTYTITDLTTEGEDGLHVLANACVLLLCGDHHASETMNRRLVQVLHLLLSGPANEELRSLELDSTLLDRLIVCATGRMGSMQGALLSLVKLALKLRLSNSTLESPLEQARVRPSLSTHRPPLAPSPSASTRSLALTPPPQLFKCLQVGFSTPGSRNYLDQWLAFLADILPNFADAIFSNLIPLVECFCGELAKTHGQLVAVSHTNGPHTANTPEPVIMNLLEGLEMLLDRAYECLLVETAHQSTTKENDAKPTFFSNVAAGMFKAEGPPSRTAQANSRLTVILTFQDAIRVGLKM